MLGVLAKPPAAQEVFVAPEQALLHPTWRPDVSAGMAALL